MCTYVIYMNEYVLMAHMCVYVYLIEMNRYVHVYIHTHTYTLTLMFICNIDKDRWVEKPFIVFWSCKRGEVSLFIGPSSHAARAS